MLKWLRSAVRPALGTVLAFASCLLSLLCIFAEGNAFVVAASGVVTPFAVALSGYLLWWLATHQWEKKKVVTQKPVATQVVVPSTDKVGPPQPHTCDTYCHLLLEAWLPQMLHERPEAESLIPRQRGDSDFAP